MKNRNHRPALLLLIALLLIGLVGFYLWQAFPQFWLQSQRWKMELSRYISQLFNLASQHPVEAMWTTLIASLSYGFLHAVGPGHGKVIMSTYLSTHPAKLKTSLKFSLCAAMLQAIVAISLVSVLLLALDSGISQINAQAEHLISMSYVAMILLGLIVAWKALKQYFASTKSKSIVSIKPPIIGEQLKVSAVPFAAVGGASRDTCGCGHQHVANADMLSHANSRKDYLAIVFSIGIRPCSGALMALIFAKSLNVYWLGVISALAMGFGTAVAIGLLAWLSLSGGKLAKRYSALSGQKYQVFRLSVKLVAASLIGLIGGIMLLSQPVVFSPILSN